MNCSNPAIHVWRIQRVIRRFLNTRMRALSLSLSLSLAMAMGLHARLGQEECAFAHGLGEDLLLLAMIVETK